MRQESSIARSKFDFWRRAFDNPVVLKEAIALMRGGRGLTLVVVYLSLLSLFVVFAYFFAKSEGDLSGGRLNVLQQAGKTLFGATVLSELLLIMFIAPALTSGAISSERERQTFDLLRVSLLSPRALIFGKLASTMAYLLLLMFSAVPLQSLAFLFGGVDWVELAISLVMLFAAALQFSSMGLYFSVVAKRAVASSILAYGMTFVPVILEVLFYYWLVDAAPIFRLTELALRAILLFLWTSFSTNSLVAAFLSEVMLIESQNYFLFFLPSANPPLPLFSPWILYTIYALTITIAALELSVFCLKRYAY